MFLVLTENVKKIQNSKFNLNLVCTPSRFEMRLIVIYKWKPNETNLMYFG